MPTTSNLIPPRQLAPYGPAAVQALAAAIDGAQQSDRLSPVTVVVPSNLAGLSLRRTLAASRGLLNVRFLVLARLAELLGAPALATESRVPLTRWRRFEAIRAALHGGAGVFEAVAGHPSTHRALDAAFRQLRQAPLDRVSETATTEGRLGDVARLYLRFLGATTDTYDEHDLTAAARNAVLSGSATLKDIGAVIVFLAGDLDSGSRAFVDALIETGHAIEIEGLTGDPQVDATMSGNDARSVLDASTLQAPHATHIALTADAEGEARTVIRMAMVAASEAHVPLHRIAVLHPSGSDHARILHEQLASAGIPHNGPSVAPLSASVPGRALINLVAMVEGGVTRTGLFTWLRSAPILETESGDIVPARRWEELAREAGVVQGETQWNSRLAALRHVREMERAQAEQDDNESLVAAASRDIDYIDRLRVFVEELRHSLDIDNRNPAAMLAHLAHLFDRYLGTEGRQQGWPQADQAASQRVREILHEASECARVSGELTRADLAHALTYLLTAPGERIGPLGDGLFVGPIDQAVGMQFDRVFVVGMAEGQLPPPPHIDALLQDDERESLGLGSAVAELINVRRRYLAALASAPHRTLLFARADLRGGRAQQPSRWLAESASILAGQHISGSQLLNQPLPSILAGKDWVTLVPSLEAALRSSRGLASSQEFDLRMLEQGPRPTRKNPALHSPALAAVAAGIEASMARIAAEPDGPHELSHWEASTGPLPGHAAPGAPPISPTALETMACCPFKYFLRYELRVRAIEEPFDELRISPLVKGSLVHRILERFYTESVNFDDLPLPREPWGADAHRRMEHTAEEECAAYESLGLTGAPLLWQLEKRRILDSLDSLLRDDDTLRAEGFSFSAAEMAFGYDDAQAAITLADGRAIHFRGRIDRIDRDTAGRVGIYDYKTGKSGPYKGAADSDSFDCGRRLQLPVYALAMGALDPGENVTASYWFVDEGLPLKGYRVDADRLDRFAEVVGDLDATIEAGLFPANPGSGDAANCTYCVFDRVCPPKNTRLRRLQDRCAGTPGLARYAKLAGVASAEEEEVSND